MKNKLLYFTIAVWIGVAAVLAATAYTLGGLSKTPVATSVVKVPEVERIRTTYLYKEPIEEPKCITVYDISVEIVKNHYADEIAREVMAASVRYNVPIYVIYALIFTESGVGKDYTGYVKKEAESSAACRGLTQVSRTALAEYNDWHKKRYTWDEMFKVAPNIEVGVWYFAKRYTCYDTWWEAYCIYNAGFGNCSKLVKYYDDNGKLREKRIVSDDTIKNCAVNINKTAVDRFKKFESLMYETFGDYVSGE